MKIPKVSLAICFSLILAHVFFSSTASQITTKMIKLFSVHQSKEKTETLVFELCRSLEKSSEECEQPAVRTAQFYLGSRARFEPMSDLERNFLISLNNHNQNSYVSNLAAYPSFKNMTLQLNSDLSELAANENLVIGKNVTVLSSLKSLWLHVSWDHVLKNIFNLILIGFLLELFISRTYFVGTYIVGGVLAIIFAANYQPDIMVSMGASAAISALMGLAFVCVRPFHKKSFLFFVTPKITWLLMKFILIGIFMSDLIFAVMSSFSFSLDGVAYWVHVYGFIFGVLIGLVGVILKDTRWGTVLIA